MVRTYLVELRDLFRPGEMAGRIVGMDHDNASRARRDGLLQRMHVDMPAVIVKKRIADELYVIHVRQEIKQRIAGRGNQEFVAGIAQQAKNERVRLAGAGSEEQIIDEDLLAAFSVIVN